MIKSIPKTALKLALATFALGAILFLSNMHEGGAIFFSSFAFVPALYILFGARVESGGILAETISVIAILHYVMWLVLVWIYAQIRKAARRE